VDLQAAILEDLHGGGRERIGDENFRRHDRLQSLLLSSSAKADDPVIIGVCTRTKTLCVLDAPLSRGHDVWERHAALRNASLLLATAQWSQTVSASTSARSTVEPHQMRKPGGASR